MDSKIGRDLRRLGGRKERLAQRRSSWPKGGGFRKGLQGRVKLKAHVSRGTVVWPLTAGREVSNSSSHRMISIFCRKVHAAVHCPPWSPLWLKDNVGYLAMVFPWGRGMGGGQDPCYEWICFHPDPWACKCSACWPVLSKRCCLQLQLAEGPPQVIKGGGSEQAPPLIHWPLL